MNIDFKNSPVLISHMISGSSLKNVWKLLADNNFKISSRNVPKLLLALPILLLNIPFVLLEKLLYSKKIEKTAVRKPLFILGYPRSGTTYLVYLLSKDPQFAYSKMYECMGPNVMFTFGFMLRMIAKLVLPAKRPMDNLELGADVPKEEEFALGNMGVASMANAMYFPTRFSNYFDRFVLFKHEAGEKKSFEKNLLWLYKKLTLKNDQKRLLLKSPFNTGRVKFLLKLFPDAKFIHIHRHPYKVYSSNVKLYESVLPAIAFHPESNEQMEQHIFYTYRETMQTYFDDKKLLAKNQLIEVRYEDFVSNPVAFLKTAYAQLEIDDFESARPHLEKEVKEYANFKTNKHADDPHLRNAVYEQWKFAYDVLNYEK